MNKETSVDNDKKRLATTVVESLRKGIPPRRGVNLYSVGNEKFLEGIKRFHLSGIADRGIIRFASGSWGAGKTHFFRQLREVAFDNNCLVSTVELSANSAALNKFQSVFSAIIREISTPHCEVDGAAPFGKVICESLSWLATGKHEVKELVPYEQYTKACQLLMQDHGIDIDFKKMVQEYWKTFLPNEASVPAINEQLRDEILQWFFGEGSVGAFRKRFGVSKMVSKENAKLLLGSLANFVRLSGYQGLLILFDEAEQGYSVMRKSSLREAHNNLLSLINNIESLNCLFMIYATTPDFYDDPKHGISIYGALSGRIGRPVETPPRALDTIWNLDAVETKIENYQEAANKIREVYLMAYPEAISLLPDEKGIAKMVADLSRKHPPFASVRFWRLLVTAIIMHFDDHLQGSLRSTDRLYDDVMNQIRED